jgi:ATP-dependent Clp protease ATP-binding subunit ClpA
LQPEKDHALSRRFQKIDIKETSAPNVVKGWKQGLEELLATVEDDLSGYFLKHSP